MKQVSMTEFKSLAARNDWKFEQSFSELFPISDTQKTGIATKVSILEDIKITVEETFFTNTGHVRSINSDPSQTTLSIAGVNIMDEDGEEACLLDIEGLLPPSFFGMDYSKVSF